jgi:hypothetical protein
VTRIIYPAKMVFVVTWEEQYEQFLVPRSASISKKEANPTAISDHDGDYQRPRGI